MSSKGGKAPLAVGSSNKIFVGGLPQSCPEDVLTNYFMQYGAITDSVVMKDRETGNSRGFGFVTFEEIGAVDMIMAQYDDHKINKKWVEVKRAIPQAEMPPGSATGKGGGRHSTPGSRDNHDDRDRSPRPSDSRELAVGGDVRPGDWQCFKCNANVFASKSSCFKCGASKNDSSGGGGPSAGPGMHGYPGTPMGYPPLPQGWEQVMDPQSGRPYFCNRATGETSWTPPAPPGYYGYPAYPGGHPGYPGGHPGYPSYGGYPYDQGAGHHPHGHGPPGDGKGEERHNPY